MNFKEELKELASEFNKRCDDLIERHTAKDDGPNPGDWYKTEDTVDYGYFRFVCKITEKSWQGLSVSGHTAYYDSDRCKLIRRKNEHNDGDFFTWGACGSIYSNNQERYHCERLKGFVSIPREIMQSFFIVAGKKF